MPLMNPAQSHWGATTNLGSNITSWLNSDYLFQERVENEIKDLKTQHLIDQQELLNAIEVIHNDVRVHLKKRDKEKELEDAVFYGRKVWTKTTGAGPFITIKRVASKIDIGSSTQCVMGWICRDEKGKYCEVPEEDLSTKFIPKADDNHSDIVMSTLICFSVFSLAVHVGYILNWLLL
tara:strand:+ start:20274 stop:20807 length:534 start_codon:yes stop_codon:yes gene_type:complete